MTDTVVQAHIEIKPKYYKRFMRFTENGRKKFIEYAVNSVMESMFEDVPEQEAFYAAIE